MSKLEVDKITPQSGTTLTIGEAGDTTVVNGLGTLPATIGSATQVLSVNAGATGLVYGTAATDLSNLNATNLTSGTVPDGRFPSVLPAAGGQNLTSLQPAAIVGGTFGAINSANLTNLNATALTSGTIPAARISSLPAGVGGKILQVVSAAKTDSFATTSTSFTDITGITVAITPAATSSKILVMVDLVCSLTNTTGELLLKRGSTSIYLGDAAGARGRVNQSVYMADANSSTSATMVFLDSPSSTSAVTYKVQGRTQNGSYALAINRSQSDQDSAARFRGASSITLMEVGA